MRRVLVVDDDPQRLERLKRCLESHDFIVLTASAGHMAMDRLYGAAVDLVITDVALPDFDGYDLASYIGLVRSDLPVVALTDERDFIEGIFDQVLQRSLPDSDLVRCFLKLLRDRPLPASFKDDCSDSDSGRTHLPN